MMVTALLFRCYIKMRSLLIVFGAALLVGTISALVVAPLEATDLKLMGAVVGGIMLVAGLRKSDRRRRR